jgi:simple sugar transport system ATP-binding protein
MDNEQLRKPVPISMDRTPLFELRGICKNFSGVQALMDGNLVLHQREIHALVGGNGAGKSTLVNILSGNYPPEAGEILHHGKPISIDFPKVARHLGIATIYQNLSLVGTLDVTANLFLGQEIMTPPPLGWFGFLSKKKMQREAVDEFARLGINIPNVKSKVDRMSGDEPTAALGVRETEEILDLMYKCRNEGAAVLLISHNMEQVFRVADTITVLRLGQTVAQVRRDEVTSTQIVGLITGAIEKL